MILSNDLLMNHNPTKSDLVCNKHVKVIFHTKIEKKVLCCC